MARRMETHASFYNGAQGWFRLGRCRTGTLSRRFLRINRNADGPAQTMETTQYAYTTWNLRSDLRATAEEDQSGGFQAFKFLVPIVLVRSSKEGRKSDPTRTVPQA